MEGGRDEENADESCTAATTSTSTSIIVSLNSRKKEKKKEQRSKKRKLLAQERENQEQRKIYSESEEDRKTNANNVQKEECLSLQISEDSRNSKEIFPTELTASTSAFQSNAVSEKKKRVYGVWLQSGEPHSLEKENDGDKTPSVSANQSAYSYQYITQNFHRSGESREHSVPPQNVDAEQQKKHTGLRCRKCFTLLLRDKDFQYRNGKLWATPSAIKEINLRKWQGLILQGQLVYCQNMHIVGFREPTTFANERVYSVGIKAHKTTFLENFTNNPTYKGGNIAERKSRFANNAEHSLRK